MNNKSYIVYGAFSVFGFLCLMLAFLMYSLKKTNNKVDELSIALSQKNTEFRKVKNALDAKNKKLLKVRKQKTEKEEPKKVEVLEEELELLEEEILDENENA